MDKPAAYSTELLTYHQVAAELHMSKKWVEKQVWRGRLMKVKLGSRPRIERIELERFIIANRITKNPPDPQLNLFPVAVTVADSVTTPSGSEGSPPDSRKLHVVDRKRA